MCHVNGGSRGLEVNKTTARKAWVSSNIFPLRCSLYSRVITKFKLITFKCFLCAKVMLKYITNLLYSSIKAMKVFTNLKSYRNRGS
jgi:hypothetical protein